jgi:hypothetical protein
MCAAVMTTPSKARPTTRTDTENPPAGWETPSKVMQKFRMKKRALDQRLTAPAPPSATTSSANSRSEDVLLDNGAVVDDSELEDGIRNPFKVPRLSFDPVTWGVKAKADDVRTLDADTAIWRLISSVRVEP